MFLRHLNARAIAVLSIILASSHVSFAAPVVSSDPKLLCGPNCMVLACSKLGVKGNLEEMKTLSKYNDKRGTNLLGLMKAAQTKGLQAAGMKISLEELVRFKGVSIAHVWDNHFVLVESGEAGTVVITNPPAEPVVAKMDEFKKYYSGFALLLSKDASLFPENTSNGSDMRFDEYSWDLGKLFSGETATHEFRFKNVGNQELRISKVTASSPELAALCASEIVPPSGTGSVEVVFDGTDKTGLQSGKIELVTNDPVCPVIVLGVSGYLRSTKLKHFPQVVDFGDVNRSSGGTQTLVVRDIPEDPVVVKSVSVDLPYIDASVRKQVGGELPGYTVDLKMKKGAPIGPVNGKLVIVSNHVKEPRVEVPIKAVVTGDIVTDKDSFFFGMVKKETSAKAVVSVTSTSKSPLKIKSVESSLPSITIESQPDAKSNGYVLTATLKTSDAVGSVGGDITIHTNSSDQPVIKLPVCGLIED